MYIYIYNLYIYACTFLYYAHVGTGTPMQAMYHWLDRKMSDLNSSSSFLGGAILFWSKGGALLLLGKFVFIGQKKAPLKK